MKIQVKIFPHVPHFVTHSTCVLLSSESTYWAECSEGRRLMYLFPVLGTKCSVNHWTKGLWIKRMWAVILNPTLCWEWFLSNTGGKEGWAWRQTLIAVWSQTNDLTPLGLIFICKIRLRKQSKWINYKDCVKSQHAVVGTQYYLLFLIQMLHKHICHNILGFSMLLCFNKGMSLTVKLWFWFYPTIS